MSLHAILNPHPALPSSRQRFSNAVLRRMIAPLIIEQLLQMIVGIVDTLMVSYAGEAVVSGVSLMTMLFRVFQLLFTAAAAGGAIIIAQYLGRENPENAGTAAAQTFFLSFLLSIGCMLFAFILGPWLLRMLYPQVEQSVMDACRVYLHIVSMSFPAAALYHAGAALYRALGQTRLTLKVSLVMNVINAAGNAIGVFVLKAGAAGVAWPTALSWLFAGVAMTYLAFRQKKEIVVNRSNLFMLNRGMSFRILRVAVPNAAEQALFQAAKVVLGSLVAVFGTSQIAANGIAQTFWSLSGCLCTAVSPAFVTVIGQCMGAKDPEAAVWYMRKLLRVTLMLSIGWNLLATLPVPLLLPFYAVTEETRQTVLLVVIIHNVFSSVLEPFTMPLSGGLRAAGDVHFTLWSSVLCTVFFRTVFAWWLGLRLGMGLSGVAWAMVLDWCLKAVLDVVRFRGGQWKQKRLI